MATISITADTNLSAVTYADGDILSIDGPYRLTINASNTVNIGRVASSRPRAEAYVENLTNTPIIINMGQSGTTAYSAFYTTRGAANTIKGQAISIGTGNGVAGQTFNLPTSDLGLNMPLLAGLWVEGSEQLRDGTPVPTKWLRVDSSMYSTWITHPVLGNVFTQDTTANTVTFKNAVPSGQTVYMSSVIIQKANNYSALTQITNNSGGNTTIEHAHLLDCQLHALFSNQWSIDHVTASTSRSTGILSLEYGGKSFSAKNLIMSVLPGASFSPGLISNQPNSSPSWSMKNAWCNSNSREIAIGGFGASVERINVTYDGTAQNTRNALDLDDVTAGYIYDAYVAWPSIALSVENSRDLTIDNVNFSTQNRSDYVGTFTPNAALLVDNQRVTLTNFHQMDPADTGLTPICGNSFFSLRGTDLHISDVTVHSGPAGSGTQRWNGFIYNGVQNLTVQNVEVHGEMNGSLHAEVGGRKRCRLANINYNTTQVDSNKVSQPAEDFFCERIADGSNRTTPNATFDGSAAAASDVQSALTYPNGVTDRSVGRLLTFIYPALSRDPHVYWASGSPGVLEFDKAGLCYVSAMSPTTKIYVESETYNGITGCSDRSWQVSWGGSSQTFQVRRRGGVWSAEASFTAVNVDAAISALSPSGDNDVQFRFILLPGTPTATSYFGMVSLTLDLDGRSAATLEKNFDEAGDWNKQLTNYTTPGTFGEMLQQIHLNSLAAASVRIETIE